MKRPIIACVPVDLPPGSPPYPNTDYEQWTCGQCGQLMYVGPKSIERNRADGTPLACMPCALADLPPGQIFVGNLGGR